MKYISLLKKIKKSMNFQFNVGFNPKLEIWNFNSEFRIQTDNFAFKVFELRILNLESEIRVQTKNC